MKVDLHKQKVVPRIFDCFLGNDDLHAEILSQIFIEGPFRNQAESPQKRRGDFLA